MFDAEPSSREPKSQPPPLPEEASVVTAERATADAAAADRMLDRLAASDYAGALTAAEALLLHQPLDADALECAEMARSELRRLYVSRLGSLERVPFMAVGLHGLMALSLEFRAGFVLSRVDRCTSLQRIADECGLPPLDALRLLSELYLQRVIAFEDESFEDT
jgi:hypothetical protein